MATLDHLVVAARDLASGTRWLEERLGVALAGGGVHAAMGTHNRLLKLGGAERLYLELIAIDPAAPSPGRPRWFGLDTLVLQERLRERPRLIHWVARSDDLLHEATQSQGEILAMQRGDFRWRITVPADGRLPGAGKLPSLIQWDVPFHPVDRLPDSGCTLVAFDVTCVPELAAILNTPRGRAVLD